jgi:hypothetical protein
MPAVLLSQAEEAASEIRARSRLEPGTPMRDVCRALGVDIEEDRLNSRVRAISFRSESLILLRPSGYRPRDEFSIAHELLELYGPWSPEVPAATKELLCDRGAAALLLPSDEFLKSARAERFDLAVLRRRWPLASWGALSCRISDLVPGAVSSTWVNGRRRGARSAHEDPGVAALEREAHHAALARGHQSVRRGSLRAAAWRLTTRNGRSVVVAVSGRV